jgi:hypothetical protein
MQPVTYLIVPCSDAIRRQMACSADLPELEVLVLSSCLVGGKGGRWSVVGGRCRQVGRLLINNLSVESGCTANHCRGLPRIALVLRSLSPSPLHDAFGQPPSLQRKVGTLVNEVDKHGGLLNASHLQPHATASVCTSHHELQSSQCAGSKSLVD